MVNLSRAKLYCCVAGALLAASSSDRLEKIAARGFGSRSSGGELAEAQASLPVFLLLLILAALAYTLLILVLCAIARRLNGRQADVVLTVLVGGVCVAFFIAYPSLGLPQSSAGFGDEDDAINILITSVLDASNPYVIPTYIGNPVSPLMGSAVIGAPFYAFFGSAGYQNPFIVLAVVIACRSWLGSRFALIVLVAAFSSAGFAEYYLLGGDYFVIGAAAAACSFFYMSCLTRGRHAVFGSILLAVTACTRMSYLVVAVVVVAIGWLLTRKRAGIVGGTIVLGMSALFVLPWLIMTGYESFFPLQAARLLGPSYFQVVSTALLVVFALYAVIRRRVEYCYLIGLAALPVLFVDPGQLFRVSSFVWWGLPLLSHVVLGIGAQTASDESFVPTTDEGGR